MKTETILLCYPTCQGSKMLLLTFGDAVSVTQNLVAMPFGGIPKKLAEVSSPEREQCMVAESPLHALSLLFELLAMAKQDGMTPA